MKANIARSARQIVRELRKSMTPSERILWDTLKNRKLGGKRFLRQHPIFCRVEFREAFFVADFYCHEHRLVIEVDGKVHERQQEYDQSRTEVINQKGIRVIRFRNEEIERNLQEVLKQIQSALETPAPTSHVPKD